MNHNECAIQWLKLPSLREHCHLANDNRQAARATGKADKASLHRRLKGWAHAHLVDMGD